MEIGQINTLHVSRFFKSGVYLKDTDGEEVLLPNKFVPEEVKEGDEIDVFLYTDSEDRLVATTQKPKIYLDQFAYLNVKEITTFGSFVDWGLDKDLLVPFREQKKEMQPGYNYVVYLTLDGNNRLIGTTKLEDYISDEPEDLEIGHSVHALIYSRSDLGFSAIVDQKYHGMIYLNEVFSQLKIGDSITAFVKNIREDGKIDLSLQKTGFKQIEDSAEILLKAIQDKGGFLALTDNSDPEEIRLLLNMSKKNFKKAVGSLYKLKKVQLEKTGIRLTSGSAE